METQDNDVKQDGNELTESELVTQKLLEVIDLIPCKRFTTKSDFYKWLAENE